MAYTISLRNKQTNQRRTAYVGFSWTTFFFGFWPAVCRGDWKWALIQFAVWTLGLVFTFGIVSFIGVIYFAFNYNRLHKEALLDDGFEEEDPRSQFVA